MDLNHLLIWTVAVGSGLTVLQLFGQKGAGGRMLAPLSVLAILVISLLLIPGKAGYFSGVALGLLMLIPGAVNAWLGFLLTRKRFRLAWSLSLLLAVLQPWGENRRLPRFIRALSLLHRREADRGLALLHDAFPLTSPLGLMALVIETRHRGSWQALLDRIENGEFSDRVMTDPLLVDAFLQALGETGRREEMIAQYCRLTSRQRDLSSTVLNMIRVKVAAFCGDPFVVAQLLTGPLRNLSEDVKRFWSATALQVSGEAQTSRRDFEWVSVHADPPYAMAAERRLNFPLPTFLEQPLRSEEVAVVSQISAAAEHEIQHTSLRFPSSRRCWGTWTLATTLVLVFLLEIPGGTENFENLERMGALIIPADSAKSDTWRMVTAAFLHFGAAHLLTNLLGLIILGRRLEIVWGTTLLSITYLVSAVGSIGLAPLFISAHPEAGRLVLVGASGGVMGLIGGLLLQAAIDLLRGRNRDAFREFTLLLVVVVVQTIFDANTPNVSSEAHLLGMTIGIVCGTLWNLVWVCLRRKGHMVPSA